jgi:hypothetical protein
MDSLFRQCPGYLADTGNVKGLGVFAARDLEPGEAVEIAPVVRIASALGYGGMYSHANPANLRFAACMDDTAISFVAVRAIASGEELTINYTGAGGDPESDSDNGFRSFGIEPIGP